MAEFDLSKMPYSLEAEQSVLGSILIDPECLNEVAILLEPADFYVSQNVAIYSTMLSRFSSGESIDVVTLLDRMKAEGEFDEAQTKSYIVEMAEFVPTTANVKKYADIVKEKSLLRSMINVSREISDACFEEAGAASDILDMAEQKVYDIAHGRSRQGFTPVIEAVTNAYDRLSAMASGDKEKYAGIPTHFVDLDRRLGGLSKSDLILIAARPGMGKTAFALNIAENVAILERKKVAIFSLEMSKEQLVMRILSSQSRVDSRRLLAGEVQDSEWPRIAEAAGVISGCPIKIDDTSGVKISDMKAKLRRERDVDLVIIDYLQLMESGGRFDSRVNEVSQITRGLKIMARELDIPVICLSQLSRGPEQRTDHRPMLADLRESGSIEQDADIVLFLYRPGYYDEAAEEGNQSEVIIAKNRHGPTGSIEVLWMGEYTKFMNLEQNR